MAGTAKAGIVALITLALTLLAWSWFSNEDPATTSGTNASTPTAESSDSGTATLETTAAASEEAAAPTAEQPESAQPIERREVVGKLRLTGHDGKAVGGRVELVKVNETFTTHFSTMARIGQAIYYDSIVQEALVEETDGSLAITADGNRADFLIVFADGFTPYLEEWKPITPGQDQVVELTPALPIAVTVLTNEGQPIEDAQVWYRWSGVFNQNESAPLLDRFRARFFQEVAATDKLGQAVLTSTFPEWSTEIFVRPGDLWATVVTAAEAGKPIEIRCPDGFMVSGAVTVNGKAPEQEVQLKATVHQGDQYWMLESGRAKEEGKYKIIGIPAGYPAYQIEAVGNGLANQTQEIFAPTSGSIVQLDFAMEQGHGGNLLLKDPWGEPIQSGRIKFVAEGDRNHMYGYDSDANGLIELPPSFRKGESWWLNLRLGDNLYLRLMDAFQVGESSEVSVPNLARITEVKIDKDLLDNATVNSVTWNGLSSQSWGSVTWNPQTGGSPLLASGSAALEITLTNGRHFRQPVVLPPGARDSISVNALPTTLTFELPEAPAAYVSITDQHGATVFEEDELSGQVSVPLWQGNFSLVAIWPETAREIPLVRIQFTDVDLGRIEATASGFVEGVVEDSNGNPVQWAELNFTSISGYSSQFFRTDADGRFAFFDLPLGQYYILYDTSQSYGSQSATMIEKVTVTADRLHQNITLQIPAGAKRVRLTCDNSWAFNAFAILATAQASTHAEVRSQGPTLIAAQSQPGWLGVAQILDGQIRALAMQVAAGPGEYSLPSTSMRTSTLHFVDELGQPWSQLLLRLELVGHPLIRRPTVDSTGALTVTANPSAPWSLQVCAPSGQALYFDLASLGSDETLTIPQEIVGNQITVQNEAGDAIPWPTLQSADGSTVFPSDKDGQATIPSKYTSALVVSASGYLACWIANPRATTTTLPKRIDGVQVQVPNGTKRLSWTSDSPYESLWAAELELAPGQNRAELPPFHKGSFTFSAFAADGTQLATTTAKVDHPGQMLTLDG